MDHRDLVKRLREQAALSGQAAGIEAEAADCIEALLGEKEHLVAKVEKFADLRVRFKGDLENVLGILDGITGSPKSG